MTVAERTRKHRAMAKERDLQAALAISRIVLGRDAQDSARALASWLDRIASREDAPEAYVDEIQEAIERLRRRRR